MVENSKRDIVRSIFLGLGAGQKSSDMHDTIYKYKRKEREMTQIGQVLGRPNNSSIFFDSILVNIGYGSDRI